MNQQTKRSAFNIKSVLTEQPVLILFVLFIIVMAFVKPSFLSGENIKNIFMDISVYGVVACAMTIAIICGEFDLSASSVFIWSQIFFITVLNAWGVIPAIFATFLSGVLIGSLNGVIVAFLKINSFITTLGTMTIFKGLSLVFTDGEMVKTTNEFIAGIGSGTFLGLSYLTYIYIAVILLAAFVLKYTNFGRRIYSTGGNINAAALSGIKVKFYKFVVFVILGFASALAGMMFVTEIRAGSVLYGTDLSLTAVAATVIGGTSLSGGSGGILRTFIGMLIIGVLYKALIFLGMQAYYQNLIKGLVLLVVVAVDAYITRSGAVRKFA
jgi:ribose transport system permease protein